MKPGRNTETDDPSGDEARETADPVATSSAPILPASLRVIPVDPHRIFVRWQVSAEALAQAAAANEAGDARLILRVVRSESAEATAGPATIDEFPAELGWHEGFYSLAQPGGSVVAGLGVKGSARDFEPLVYADRVEENLRRSVEHLLRSDVPAVARGAEESYPVWLARIG